MIRIFGWVLCRESEWNEQYDVGVSIGMANVQIAAETAYNQGMKAGRDLEFRTAQDHKKGMEKYQIIIEEPQGKVATIPHPEKLDYNFYNMVNADVIENKINQRKTQAKLPPVAKIIESGNDNDGGIPFDP